MRFHLVTQTLVQNFTHIGFHRTATNNTYRFYLLGYHYNVSIINPALTITALRRVTAILTRLLVRRHKSCVITHKLSIKSLDGSQFFYNQQYLLDYWIPGTFSNKRFSHLFGVTTRRYYLRARVPSVILLLGLPEKKVYDVYKELKPRGLICIPFLDSDCEAAPYSYVVPTNTKSPATIYFFLEIFSSIFNYSRVLTRRGFITHVFKKKKR